MIVTQDDARETEQVSLFELNHLAGRSNKYIPDATITVDDVVYNLELKTSDVASKQVSTGRNVTIPKLETYRNVSWIFSQYKKLEEGFEFTGEHYFLHGDQLDPWLIKQRDKILSGTKTYAGVSEWEDCKRLLKKKMPETTLERLDNTFFKKGVGLNDPKISWTFIEKAGTKLDMNRPHDHVKEILSERRVVQPLISPVTFKNNKKWWQFWK